jgi:hypothetical protein
MVKIEILDLTMGSVLEETTFVDLHGRTNRLSVGGSNSYIPDIDYVNSLCVGNKE